MAQNSKVQKCTIIDVSLSYPMPPAKNDTLPYVHRTLLWKHTHQVENSGLSVWSEMFAMIMYSCLLCVKKRSQGPGQAAGGHPFWPSASHEPHTAHSFSVSSSSVLLCSWHSPVAQEERGPLSPGWLRTMAPGYSFMFINSFHPYDNGTSMVNHFTGEQTEAKRSERTYSRGRAKIQTKSNSPASEPKLLLTPFHR